MSDEEIINICRIQIVACGSAYYVKMSAKYVIEEIAQIPVDVASEFRYRKTILDKVTL